jgi:hypothetical protein
MIKLTKYLLLLLVLFAALSLINSVNAINIQKLDKNNVVYNTNDKWSYISISIVSSKIGSDYKMKQDLDQVNKIVIKVNGKTIDSTKRNSEWKKHYPVAIIERNIIYTGNIKGKKVGIYVYDKNNKLIKSKVAKVSSVMNTKQMTSKKEAMAFGKATLKLLDNPYYKLGAAKFFVNKYKQGYWLIDYVDTRSNKIVGQIPVDDVTGGVFNG